MNQRGSQIPVHQQHQQQHVDRPLHNLAGSASASSQSSSISSGCSSLSSASNTNCCQSSETSSQMHVNQQQHHHQQQQLNQAKSHDNLNETQFLRPSDVSYKQQQYCPQMHPNNSSHGLDNPEDNVNLKLNVNSDNNSCKMKISPIQQAAQLTTPTTMHPSINDNNLHAQIQDLPINVGPQNVNTNNLQAMEEAETRIICQFHYTTWPDHGAPRSMQPILEMVRLMREVQPAEDRPILVHCSAGCGRTGTICCIDYVWGLLRRGELDPSFDLCSIISEMRQQRMAMVQTLEQYILCHRAVAALFIDQLKLIDDHTYENLDDLNPLDAVEASNRAEPITLAGPNSNVHMENRHQHNEQDHRNNLQSYNDLDENENYQDDDDDDNSFLISDDDNMGPVFI